MKYATTSTRWQAIVYDYETSYPLEDKIEKATPKLSQGYVSIAFSRSKDSVQSTANIELVGPIAPQWRIGNWVVLKSKTGTFSNPNEISPITEGIVRFIGQIVEVNVSYRKAENGLFHRQTSVLLREWSGVLLCPVRLEMGAAEQAAFGINNAATQASGIAAIGKAEGAQNLNDFVRSIAESQFDAFDYVRLVLGFIGMSNSSFQGTESVFTESQNKSLTDFANQYAKSAMYLPHIPQSLLDYLGMNNIKPEAAFNSTGGFAGLVLGVQDKNSSITSAYDGNQPQDIIDKKSFNGIFKSFKDIQSQYKNYKDRPRTEGMALDFSAGRGAWEIIRDRSDTTYNECFTDMWYCKKPLSGQSPADATTGNSIYPQPVIVMRDKPFAIKKYLDIYDVNKKSWSNLDNVPRVWIDNVYIKQVSNKSSFYDSPNYIQPTIANDTVTDTFYNKNLLLAFALRTVRPEMNRFGGIKYFPSTPFIAQEGKPDEFGQDWFKEATTIQYLHHGLNYRFGQGTILLKDNNIPIMVGCNITFPIGDSVLCAHVESVSWSFMVNADGSITNDCQISYSHLCQVQEDGSLDFLNAYELNHLTEVQDSVEDTSVRLQTELDARKLADEKAKQFVENFNKA